MKGLLVVNKQSGVSSSNVVVKIPGLSKNQSLNNLVMNYGETSKFQKENGKLIGILTEFLVKGKAIEIGYGIGSNYWNNGYVTEAVEAFIPYLFNERGFDTVYASCFIDNPASKRVMEKVGMTYSHTNYGELDFFPTQIYFAPPILAYDDSLGLLQVLLPEQKKIKIKGVFAGKKWSGKIKILK